MTLLIKQFIKQFIRLLIKPVVLEETIPLKIRIRKIQDELHPQVNINNKYNVLKKNKESKLNSLLFDLVFRGSEDLIKQRHTFYLKYFKKSRSVLDIGCGRGEFLEILKMNGVDATGIDINKQKVGYCKKKNLKVVHASFEKYLSDQPDNTFDGIFASQVIEHLSFDELTTLFRLCFKKLQQDGILVVETVNPHCFPAFKLFYLDPSHVKPLFPEVVKFFFVSSGYQKVKLLYLHPVNPKINMRMSASYLQFECADYTVIGTKR